MEASDEISETSQESDKDFIYEDPDIQPLEEEYDKFPHMYNADWEEVEKHSSTWLREYQATPGTKNLFLTEDSDPIDFFELIFPNDMISKVTQWTNKRAEENIDNRKRASMKMKKWHNMKVQEMRAFLGCLITMGIVKKPNVKSYWEKDSNLFSSIGICELFSRQRFCDIYSNLCLRNPLDKPAYEKDLLYKISPFINCIIESSRRYFTPDQQVTIDDAMIAFKGKNKLIQFMPLKPIRYGFKAFLLCDAMTGYVLKWKLYTKNPKDVDEDYGLTYKIMRILCKEIEGNYNIVFTDRYYTGLQILSDLRRLKIGACGTIKSDRTQLPKEFKDLANSLAQDETMYFKTGNNLLLSCWKDSALVTVCSNCFSTGNKIRTRRRKKKENEKDEEERKTEMSREMNDSVDKLEADLSEIEIYEDINIPLAIEQYNLYKQGVDRFDQKAAYYGLKLKSNRW